MKKKDFFFVVSLFAVWGGLYSKLKQEELSVIATIPEKIESSPLELHNPSALEAEMSTFFESSAEPKAALVTPPESGTEKRLGVFRTPSRSDLLKEVTEQPHAAPLALLNFADQVSTWFAGAESSVPLAIELMSHLESCVEPKAETEKLSLAVQAFCWETAARLSHLHHGQLKDRFDHLDQMISPQTRKLLELYRSLKPSAS